MNDVDLVQRNIRFLRKRKGLTQQQLAEKVGVSKSTVGAYEEFRAVPPISAILKMAALFSIDLESFLRKDISHSQQPLPNTNDLESED